MGTILVKSIQITGQPGNSSCLYYLVAQDKSLFLSSPLQYIELVTITHAVPYTLLRKKLRTVKHSTSDEHGDKA